MQQTLKVDYTPKKQRILGVYSENVKMITRLLQLPENYNFFLFGARGVGKSTLLQKVFGDPNKCLFINLLENHWEQMFLRNPDLLFEQVMALPSSVTHIIIDEVQKIPKLLDIVHALIERTDKLFILTGSSARKLKHGKADLLAGRAFVRHLFPFSFLELGDQFFLDSALQFGLLPKVFDFNEPAQKADYLRAYSHTYLKEEVWSEHLIRKLEPFMYFLEVAAQSNGDVINYSKMSKHVNVDDKSIAEYYSILEETLMGFHLTAYKQSFRKRLVTKPKFYFFDLGVVRSLLRNLELTPKPGTYEYGDLFETFILIECYKLVHYYYPDYRLSYLKTQDGLEIDLVIERPGQPLLLVEIKSSEQVSGEHLKHLNSIKTEFGQEAEYVCFSQEKIARKQGEIMIYPWQEGIKQYLGKKDD